MPTLIELVTRVLPKLASVLWPENVGHVVRHVGRNADSRQDGAVTKKGDDAISVGRDPKTIVIGGRKVCIGGHVTAGGEFIAHVRPVWSAGRPASAH